MAQYVVEHEFLNLLAERGRRLDEMLPPDWNIEENVLHRDLRPGRERSRLQNVLV